MELIQLKIMAWLKQDFPDMHYASEYDSKNNFK